MKLGVRTAQQIFDALLARYEVEVAEAFMQAIAEIKSRVALQRVIDAIARRDFAAAVAAIHLEPAAFNQLQDAVQRAYEAGGGAAVDGMPTKGADGARLVIRFDGRNPTAEAWLKAHSSALVTWIVDDQRTAIQTALAAGMERGDNPRTVALDVVGRINRVSGKREGGIIGLSAPFEQYVRSARDELASEDPPDLRHYLTRERRDRRFDRSVTKAIREGGKVPAGIAAKALGQYQNRLLALRGEMIGRKEAMTSLQASKFQAYAQAAADGKVEADTIRRTWRTAGDLRVRHTHQGMNGESVGLYQAFASPSGAQLMYPGDTSLGAPASEVIGCRCDVGYRIDFFKNLR